MFNIGVLSFVSNSQVHAQNTSGILTACFPLLYMYEPIFAEFCAISVLVIYNNVRLRVVRLRVE